MAITDMRISTIMRRSSRTEVAKLVLVLLALLIVIRLVSLLMVLLLVSAPSAATVVAPMMATPLVI